MEIRGILERRQRMVAFAASALLLFVLHQAKGIVDYPYDSTVYWNLSKTSFITNFPDIVRGYVFPLLVWPSHALGDLVGFPFLAFRIFSSLIYAYLLSGPAAEFFLRVFGGRLSFYRRLAFVVAIALIYPGLIVYPLSDLPAALMVVLSGAAAMASEDSKRPWLLVLASGATAYAAYNTRTIYLFSLIAIALMLPFVIHRSRASLFRLLSVLFFIIGATAVAIPQMLINHRHHGTYSPAVLATVKGKSLMATQLFWGVAIQRYETSVSTKVPAPSLYYRDPAGIVLRDLYPRPFEDGSIESYIGLVAKHPVQFLGIYGRHVANGMDVRDGIVYSRRASQNRNGVALACLATIFGCLLIAFSRKRRGKELLALAPMLLAVVAILPGAVETRFFVPVYLILLGAAVTQFELAVVKDVVCRRWAVLGAGLVAAAAVSLAITSAAMASLSYALP